MGRQEGEYEDEIAGRGSIGGGRRREQKQLKTARPSRGIASLHLGPRCHPTRPRYRQRLRRRSGSRALRKGKAIKEADGRRANGRDAGSTKRRGRKRGKTEAAEIALQGTGPGSIHLDHTHVDRPVVPISGRRRKATKSSRESWGSRQRAGRERAAGYRGDGASAEADGENRSG
ncbi:hypothetical protein B0H10DRAFT_1938545 [Mycena sp. CBHHK59/15]|nr:hypothetical protein B0H10DRAFT_1938545 [Mycena sp. CBHHK59/15]